MNIIKKNILKKKKSTLESLLMAEFSYEVLITAAILPRNAGDHCYFSKKNTGVFAFFPADRPLSL